VVAADALPGRDQLQHPWRPRVGPGVDRARQPNAGIWSRSVACPTCGADKPCRRLRNRQAVGQPHAGRVDIDVPSAAETADLKQLAVADGRLDRSTRGPRRIWPFSTRRPASARRYVASTVLARAALRPTAVMRSVGTRLTSPQARPPAPQSCRVNRSLAQNRTAFSAVQQCPVRRRSLRRRAFRQQ
jgi:hypothetical protein